MNNIKKIIMVRHGETIWNKEKRIQGNSDSPLTEYGIMQAEKTGKKLTTENIDEIYSSNLGRAMRTAEIINKYLALDIKPLSGLRERKYGILEGITFSDLSVKYPEIKEKLYSHDSEYKIPEGESFTEFAERVFNCINNIVRSTNSKTILLIVHGGVIESFFYKVMQLPLNQKRNFSLFNSSINKFSFIDDGWILDTWGSIEHLDAGGTLTL